MHIYIAPAIVGLEKCLPGCHYGALGRASACHAGLQCFAPATVLSPCMPHPLPWWPSTDIAHKTNTAYYITDVNLLITNMKQKISLCNTLTILFSAKVNVTSETCKCTQCQQMPNLLLAPLLLFTHNVQIVMLLRHCSRAAL